jgi:hypothetical protein
VAITAGQTVKASDLNALSGLTACLTADSSIVNNSTAFVSTNLVIAVAANTTYAMESFVIFDSSATADYKCNFLLPVGATMLMSLWGSGVGATAVDSTIFHDSLAVTTLPAGGVASGTLMTLRTAGTITIAATAGNVTYQFAQNTATAVNTFIKTGSWIKVTPVRLV